MATTSLATNALAELFGENLEMQSGNGQKSTVEALSGLDAIGIYFSAHWCPPCRGFTPVLAERYKGLKEAGKKVEIVFVSSDRDEGAFNEYHAEMPWLALPFSDRARKQGLSSRFGVSGIPSLVFVDGNGELITDEGRGAVSSDSYVENFPYHPKPVNDLQDANGLKGKPLVVLMESLPSAEKKRLSDAVQAVAEAEMAKPASERIATSFYTAMVSGGMSAKIRSLCGLKPAPNHQGTTINEEPAMALLVLDNDDGKPGFIAASKEHLPPTEANIAAFLASYQDGKVKPQPLVTGEE